MTPYTGDYVIHNSNNKHNFKYYTFIPRPLMHRDMFKMDDELIDLLIHTHRNIGFLEGLIQYAPNKDSFEKLMLLKECTYSRMIDYESPSFHEVLVRYGGNKGEIAEIMNIELAYQSMYDKKISAPDLSKLCGIALYGNITNKYIDIRDKQSFLTSVITNLKEYNPTAPDEILPALADISAYLYNDKNTDSLIKAALVHYQFEMIHPFERYNGIIGRIIPLMVLQDTVAKTLFMLGVSKYLYHNKNEYFDLLKTTQYSGGYIRWIKFFVNAVNKTALQSAKLLMQYEHVISEDEKILANIKTLPKSVWTVYDYLKRYPIVSISHIEKQTGLSFNSVSKSFSFLKSKNIIEQQGTEVRNRIWRHLNLEFIYRNWED